HLPAAALYRDFADLRPVARAIAIRATQVDVREELHLHMLKTGATAGGATAIAAIEAEGTRRIAAFLGQPGLREQLADRIKCTYIAGRIGTRRLAHGGLVHHDHICQPIIAENAIMLARGFGGLAP